MGKCVVRDEKFVCKQNVFEVEKVIGHREVLQGSQATAEYLVLWLGYPVEDASWQPWKNLKSCIQLVHDYHNRNSRMVSRRFPNHSQKRRMSLRKMSDDADESNLTIEENSPYEWEVEDILGHESFDHAKEGKKMHYLVKWVGVREPIWSEENRVLEYDSKGDLQAYINKEAPCGETLGEGSSCKVVNFDGKN